MKYLHFMMLAIFLSACSSSKYGGMTLSELEVTDIEPEVQQSIQASPLDAIQSYRELLGFSADNPFRPRAMHRLADLLLDYGEQREIKLADKSEIQEIIEYPEAILIYEELLSSYPDYPDTDLVLYQLARVYDKQGEIDKTSQLLLSLVSHYPHSLYFSEAQFRLGELSFLYGDYQQAADSYSAVLEIGRGKPFYEQSLLKYSWTVFKQDRLDEALKSFFSLIDLKLDQVGFDPVSGQAVAIGKADQEILEDILRGMTLILALINNQQELELFSQKYGQPHYNHLIYQSLAGLYHKDERYLDEAKTYAAYIASYPESQHAGIFQLRLVDSYRFLNDQKQVLTAKETFLNDFWRPDMSTDLLTPEYRAHISVFAREFLNDLTDFYHSRFQKAKLAADFDAAVKWYQIYLKDFYQQSNAIEKHFLLAELLFENGRFQEAGKEYEQVAYYYPQHERAAEAGYSAILSYKKLLANGEDGEADLWRQLQRQSALSFISSFPNDSRVPNTVLAIANDDFERGEYDTALLLLDLLFGSEQVLVDADAFSAWTMAGHIRFKSQDYLRAEQAFHSARKHVREFSKQALESEEWLAASIYKQAEAMLVAGQRYEAVDQLLRIKTVAPGSKLAAQACYDAAAELIALEEWQRSSVLLVIFQTVYPQHELLSEVSAKLAYVYMKLGRTVDAADAYEQTANRSQDPEIQQAALLQSAQLYQQADNFSKATLVYKRYIYKYPGLSEQAFYARSALADIYARLGQLNSRDYWLGDIVKSAESAEVRQDSAVQLLAAKASLTLAESKFAEFDLVRLIEPLRENLTKKKQKMELALAAYRKTSDYNYAEFVTAASHRTGEIYFKLSTALLESARPENLDEEEMEQYVMMLEEQAYPFEEKAIKFLEANVARVDEGLYTDWIDKSYATLGKLLPVQYAKHELPSGVVDVLH